MVSGFTKDFLSINRGTIDRPTHDQSFQRFDAYFKNVSFVKWDDQTPPVVRFSNDGSVAYVAVDKLVVVETAAENGVKIKDTTHLTWLSVYKKRNGKWFLDCIASTNQ